MIIFLLTPVLSVGQNVKMRIRYVKKDKRVEFIKVKVSALGITTHESDYISVGGYVVGEPVYMDVVLKMKITDFIPGTIQTSKLYYVDAQPFGAVYTTGQLSMPKGYLTILARAESEADVDIYIGGGSVPSDTFRMVDIDGDGIASGGYVVALTADNIVELRSGVPFTALVASLVSSPERDVDVIVEEYDENNNLLGYVRKTIKAVVASISYGRGEIVSVTGTEVTE